MGRREKYVEAKVVVQRIAPASKETDDAFLILATRGIGPERGTTLYRMRWEVETMLAALESAFIRYSPESKRLMRLP